MQKSWNLGVRPPSWARCLAALVLLLTCGAACTAQIDGPAPTALGSGGSAAGPAGNQVMLCQPGLTSCNGACVNLQSENNNCGVCGNACTEPAVCVNGLCNSYFAQCDQKWVCRIGELIA